MTALDQSGKPLLCMTLAAKIVGLGEQGTPNLIDWESHGELLDEAELSKPAITEEIISAVNSANGATWTAGVNPLFAGASLKDVKRLLGTLQNTDASSFLTRPRRSSWNSPPSSIGALTPGPPTAQ